MAIQFRRGEEADLVLENLLAGEPIFCTDTLKAGIGHGDGGVTYFDSRAELLWSSATPLTPTNTATLSDDLYNYRIALLKPNNGVSYIVAPVVPGLTNIRGTTSWVPDDMSSVHLYSARGVYTSTGNVFTLNALAGIILTTSGNALIEGFTGVTEIWGIR